MNLAPEVEAQLTPQEMQELEAMTEVDQYVRGYLLLLHTQLHQPDPQSALDLYELAKHPQFDPRQPEGIELLNAALNLHVRTTHSHTEDTAGRQLELYEKGMESRGFYYKNGRIDFYTYMNIPITAYRCGNADFAFQFIEDHRYRIEGEHGDHAYLYMRAWLFFQQGNLAKAAELLKGWEVNAEYFYYKSRFLKAQVYFELGEITQVDKLLEQLRKPRKSQKLTPLRLAQQKEQVTQLNKLVKLRPDDEKKRQALIARIREHQLPSRDWFFRQLGVENG